AREGPRPVAAHRVDGGALDQRPAREHRVGGATARGLQACAALAELLGEIARPLAPGLRRERAAMPVEALDLLREAIPELRAAREIHRVGATEERQEAHLGAAARELARQLERGRAAGAEPGDDARALLARGADLAGEIAGEVFHARERSARAVEARRLQPVERLI